MLGKKIKLGRPPKTNATELSRNYIKENGPSRLGEIYYSMPQSVRLQITIEGVRNILTRMPDIERSGRGVFGLIGQYTDPLKLYPPYAETFLQHAFNQGQITEGEATNLLNGEISMTQAHGRLGYLVKRGLLRFDGRRTYSPSQYVIEIMRNRDAHEE